MTSGQWQPVSRTFLKLKLLYFIKFAVVRSLRNVKVWLKLAWLIHFSTVFQPYLVIKNDTLTENCAAVWEIKHYYKTLNWREGQLF